MGPYPKKLKNWPLERAKTPGLRHRKRPGIKPIQGRLRCRNRGDFRAAPNANFSVFLGIFAESITYQDPANAYFMIGVPIIGLLYWRLFYERQQTLKTFCGDTLLGALTERRSSLLIIIKTSLLCLSWMLATLALMKPFEITATSKSNQSTSEPQKGLPKRRVAQDVVLLVDASASMAVVDGPSKESRLTFAKQIADDLIARLQGQSVILDAFTSELVPLVPATWDYLYTRLVLREIHVNEEGTSGTDFFQTLKTLLQQNTEVQKNRTISLVILSDGGDTEYESLQGNAKKQRLDAIKGLLSDTANRLQVLSVAVGTTQGGDVPDVLFEGHSIHSAVNLGLLQTLSAGQGVFLQANGKNSFDLSKRLFDLIESHTRYEVITPTSSQTQTSGVLPSLYFIPLTLAILALSGAILLPERELRRPPA